MVPASKDLSERNKVCRYNKTGAIKRSDDAVVTLPHNEKKSKKVKNEEIVETMGDSDGTTQKNVQGMHSDCTFENEKPSFAVNNELAECSSDFIEAMGDSDGTTEKNVQGMHNDCAFENKKSSFAGDNELAKCSSDLTKEYESLDDKEDRTQKTVYEDKGLQNFTEPTLNQGHDSYLTDYHNASSAGGNNCDVEVNDYSNPRSVESLDMECHESGDDTVIVVKEKPQGKKRRLEDKCDGSVLSPKLHRTKAHGEIHFVPVGEALKIFLETHPLIQGIYLNRGKRDTKRKLVSVARQKTAIDTGSWKRGSNVHERNRLDDAFELTEEGKRRREMINKKCKRDEYVINWYLWCPGHSNCQRKCGGIGICSEGE